MVIENRKKAKTNNCVTFLYKPLNTFSLPIVYEPTTTTPVGLELINVVETLTEKPITESCEGKQYEGSQYLKKMW